MDIEYLLWLQDFRNATENAFTPFMQFMTDFADPVLLFVPVFIYWCISKRTGLFLMFSLYASEVIAYILKLTFCVQCPFVRDSRVIPLSKPSSYSFPSGHTTIAASVCGGLGVLARKKAKWFTCLCALVIVLVALSRNYMGAHTPQDVLAGAVIGLVSVWIASRVIDRGNVMLTVGLGLSVIALVYISTKTYPEDGTSLFSRARWAFYYGGALTGLAIGNTIERKCINFTPAGFNFKGIILELIGLVPYYLGYDVYRKKITGFFGEYLTREGGYFALGLVLAIYAAVVWPLVLKFTERRK